MVWPLYVNADCRPAASTEYPTTTPELFTSAAWATPPSVPMSCIMPTTPVPCHLNDRRVPSGAKYEPATCPNSLMADGEKHGHTLDAGISPRSTTTYKGAAACTPEATANDPTMAMMRFMICLLELADLSIPSHLNVASLTRDCGGDHSS